MKKRTSTGFLLIFASCLLLHFFVSAEADEVMELGTEDSVTVTDLESSLSITITSGQTELYRILGETYQRLFEEETGMETEENLDIEVELFDSELQKREVFQLGETAAVKNGVVYRIEKEDYLAYSTLFEMDRIIEVVIRSGNRAVDQVTLKPRESMGIFQTAYELLYRLNKEDSGAPEAIEPTDGPSYLIEIYFREEAAEPETDLEGEPIQTRSELIENTTESKEFYQWIENLYETCRHPLLD